MHHQNLPTRPHDTPGQEHERQEIWGLEAIAFALKCSKTTLLRNMKDPRYSIRLHQIIRKRFGRWMAYQDDLDAFEN